MIRLWLAALVLLGLAGCGTRDLAAPNAQGVCPLIRLADMPIETRGNLLYVRAGIGSAEVTLLVDTGAERTLLTEATVNRLGLPRDLQHATRTSGIGSATLAWDAKLPNGLILGGRSFPVDTVTVGPFAISKPGDPAVDGLLGADVLLAFDMDIDLPRGRLVLYHARRACPEAGPPWNEPYIPIAGIATRRDRLLVPFSLDGVTGMAILDTGAQFSAISQRMAERTGLFEEAMATDRTVMARGAAPDQVAVRLHRFRELRVGPAVMQAPMLPVVPMSDGLGDALIGADFLRGRRAWLSFSTQRLLVTPLERSAAIAAVR